MRSLFPKLLLPLLLALPAWGAPSPETPQLANVEEDVLGTPKKAPAEKPAKAEKPTADDEDAPTTFNGITVPPMTNFAGDAFDKEAKEGYWYVRLPQARGDEHPRTLLTPKS